MKSLQIIPNFHALESYTITAPLKEGHYTAVLTDVTGKELWNHSLKSGERLRLSFEELKVSSGLYVLALTYQEN